MNDSQRSGGIVENGARGRWIVEYEPMKNRNKGELRRRISHLRCEYGKR